MDTQLTTALAPKYKKGHSFGRKNTKTSAQINTNGFYNNSNKQHKGRISTYNKIVQELSKEDNNSVGKPFLSILGGSDTNIINPCTSPGRNTSVGGTLTLYPSGGIHFQNFKPTFTLDFPHISSQLSSETKGLSNRGSPPSNTSPLQLLDFVEKFNKQEDENLCPEDFLDYRDSQADELATESEEEMVNQDDFVNNKTFDNESRSKVDTSYHSIDSRSAQNESANNEQQLLPNTLAQLVSPLPTISSPSEISCLKEEIESTVIFNAPDIPTLTFKENIPNLTISTVTDDQNKLDLVSRVRSFSGSSFGRSMETTDSNNKENMSVSPLSSIPNVISWKSDDSINISTAKKSTSTFPIPPNQERRLSESFLGFFSGIFGSSPTQSLSERSDHIKEVAEMSMLFRY